MRAVVYARLSRDHTGEGIKVETQIQRCQALAKSRGWDVVAIEKDDSISAFTGKVRPGWERVQTMMAGRLVDVVIAVALDRITRSISELEKLIVLCQDTETAVTTADGSLDLTTPNGKMVARMLGVVATAEVETKGARQKAMNQRYASEGRPWRGGHRRFGYTSDMAVVPAEAEAIRDGARLFLAGSSYSEIGRLWSARGLPSPQPGRDGWSFQGVKHVLRNPVYAGIRRHAGVDYDGTWEPLLDHETHLAVVAKQATARKRKRPSGGARPTTLLTGVARCGVCEETVYGLRHHGKPVYGCITGHTQINRAQADEYVLHELGALLAHPGFMAELVAVANGDDGDAKTTYEELQRRLTELSDAYDEGGIDMEQLKRSTARLKERMAEMEVRVRTAEDGNLLMGLSTGGLDVLDQLIALPKARQRALVERFLVVTMFRVGRTGVPIEDRMLIREAKRDWHH
jgi:site-specific DNA recombinase